MQLILLISWWWTRNVSETCRELTGNKVLWRDICWLFLDKYLNIITHCECVLVACILLSSAACPTLQYFATLSHKRRDFLRKVTEHKMCVSNSSITFFWNLFHSEKSWARYCCIAGGYYCCVVDRHCFYLQDCGMYCMWVISVFHHAESSPFCSSYYLLTLLFLSKQTRHGKKTVSFYFFLFISGRAKCLSREQCVGWRM
jgi:hypothetical protein